MHRIRVAAAGAVAAAALAAALAVAGCGGTASPALTPGGPDPAGPAVTIAAQDIAFTAAEVRAPANTPFTVVFENRDAVPHNVSIDPGAAAEGGGSRAFDGAVFTGPATRWYAVPALAPGEYTFVCEIHPNMTGRLVAG